MTDSNENKKDPSTTPAQTAEAKNDTPAVVNLGDAVDPFERLQNKKVAVAQ